jgi:hypothetical protein
MLMDVEVARGVESDGGDASKIGPYAESDRLGHGSAGHEEGGFFAEEGGDFALEVRKVAALAILVVADLGEGESAASWRRFWTVRG